MSKRKQGDLQKQLNEASSIEEAFKIIDSTRKKRQVHATTLAKRKLASQKKNPIIPVTDHNKLLEQIHNAPNIEIAFQTLDRVKRRSERKKTT